MRSILAFAVIFHLLIGPASAQDRPLFQDFRIGYPIGRSLGDQLPADDTLDRNLRRVGLIASWHSFEDGLTVLRALHAGEIDIALDIAQHHVILARQEDLNMVFVAEQRLGNEAGDDAADDIRRYTLTSVHLADQRDAALLALFQALRGAARSDVRAGANRPLLRVARAHRERAYEVHFATRRRLSAAQKLADEMWAAGQLRTRFDFADVNYWLPMHGH